MQNNSLILYHSTGEYFILNGKIVLINCLTQHGLDSYKGFNSLNVF